VLLASDLRPAKGARPLTEAALADWLVRVEDMNSDELRAEWALCFAAPVPDIRSRDVLRHLMAWRVQAQIFGSYEPETLNRIRQLIADQTGGRVLKPKPVLKLTPGTILSREWKGRTHVVTVEAKGFSYEGKTYASLSEIARLITGTRWSGPRLFGLEGGR
jgi:hypothetical protein